MDANGDRGGRACGRVTGPSGRPNSRRSTAGGNDRHVDVGNTPAKSRRTAAMTDDFPAPSGPRKMTPTPPSGRTYRLTRRANRDRQWPTNRSGCRSVARRSSSARSPVRSRRTGSQSPDSAAAAKTASLAGLQNRTICSQQPAVSFRYRSPSRRGWSSSSRPLPTRRTSEQPNSIAAAGSQNVPCRRRPARISLPW